MHCIVSAYRIRCCHSSLPVSLHTFRSTAILQFVCCVLVADGISRCVFACVCANMCVCVRCVECESAWHYCLYCKSCCNFVKISTLLVCPPARWSLSSVQQCHICAPQCCTAPAPAPLPLLDGGNAADLSAVSAITAGLFLLIVGICIRNGE